MLFYCTTYNLACFQFSSCQKCGINCSENIHGAMKVLGLSRYSKGGVKLSIPRPFQTLDNVTLTHIAQMPCKVRLFVFFNSHGISMFA